MQWNNIIADLLVPLVLLLIFPFFRKARTKAVTEAQDDGFQNVYLVFNQKANALKIALITAIGIFLFLAIALLADNWVGTGSPTIPVGISLKVVTPILLAISVVFFIFSFLYNYYFLQESISYDFSGLGPGVENAYQKNFLILSAQGIRGLLALRWKEFGSMVRKDEKTITLKTLRKPIWLHSLFGMNEATVVFATAEDSVRFESQVGKYKN